MFVFTFKTMENSFILVIFPKNQIVFYKNTLFKNIARLNVLNVSSERPPNRNGQ